MLIGDVARRSGVSARMLRHYDSLGLVRPTGRTGGGYREYSEDDIRRIFHIESLRSLGLSLREVGRALDDPGFTPAELVDDLVRQTRERIAREMELLTRLRRIGAAEPAGWEDVLQVVALLQGLGSKSAGARQRAALSSVEEAPVPVEALVEAVLNEADPNVAGALRWALAQSGGGGDGGSGAGGGEGEGGGEAGGGGALALLAEGLDSPVAAVRKRAVQAVAALGDSEAAIALLRDALAHPDLVVRGGAALALGARGEADAIPTLIDLIGGEVYVGGEAHLVGAGSDGGGASDVGGVGDVSGVSDVDAADALSVLAGDPALADRIATGLVDRVTHGATEPAARRRLTQALADIPGATTSRALEELSHDEDRAVALTARYLLTLRAAR